MQNSPLNPLQPAQPNVPGVPDVPKITGVSMPAGSNKKPESPAQRSEKINAANTPKPEKPVQEQNLLHKPVTREEVEEYRRKSAKRKKSILASILILLAIGGITTIVILAKNKQQSYQELSSIYNDNIPIVINNAEGKIILIAQDGKKLTEKYDNIEKFESDRSIAFVAQEDKTISAIIDNNGNEKYSTENYLSKINKGQNYILSENEQSYVLNKDGQKLDERPLAKVSYENEQSYFLVADESKYAVINANGEEKIAGTIDGNTLNNFSYGKNEYDGNYYCAIVNTGKKDSKLHIYNCETANEIANIEDVYFAAEFQNSDSAFLITEKGSSYFYNNEMIYNSDTEDQAFIGGIIKKAENDRFFNPITKKTTESFPTDNLINQDKLDEKTTVTEDCKKYESRKASELTQICNKIYYKNKLLNLNYDKFDYYLADNNLDNFLAYNKKHYIYRKSKANSRITIIDAETNSEAFSDITIQNNVETPSQSTSRFIVKNSDQSMTVVDLATGKSADYDRDSSISLEANYYIVVESNDSSYTTKYYNADHKEIYKEEN